jgi:zinc/manganese transport system permease protein
MLELLLWPFLAGLVLTVIHAYFGLHVLARGVIFVDLSLAQVAALGLTIAILAGHPVHSPAGYWYALLFAVAGAVVFAVARPYEQALPQEALIGIVYAVSTALGVIVLDRAPLGAEHIKQLLIGSIITVGRQDVGLLALIYGGIGVVHFFCRRQLMQASFQGQATAARGGALLWDVLFYVSFALVVTSSVRLAGVLLVFSYLIVPAVLAGLLASGFARRLLIACTLGSLLTGLGLYASWTWDLPTGPAIVSTFGAAVALVVLGRAVTRLTRRRLAVAASGLAILTAAPLVSFPHLEQPWLDALADAAPIIETAFLDADERELRTEAIASIGRAQAELTRLRALDQDVRWGKETMDAERAERLRQYLAGKSEISAGDQLVLRHLRGKARERQRLALGLPLLLIGGYGLYRLLWRGAFASQPGDASGARQ